MKENISRQVRIKDIRLSVEAFASRVGSFLALAWDFLLVAMLGELLFLLIYFSVDILPLVVLRLLLGLAFVLFVPGYAMQTALFPRNTDLEGSERLALSFGLSVAIIPPLALFLDKLPWGIRLWPVTFSLALVILAFSCAAVYHRWRLPAKERFTPAIGIKVKDWWFAQGHTGRILYAVLALALTTAFLSAAALVAIPNRSDRYTEFYLLGPEGLAENYPRHGVVGQGLSVTAGVANREGVLTAYRIEVRQGERLIGGTQTFHLEPGETLEGTLNFTPVASSDDARFDFLLFRDDLLESYRSLRLFINVEE